jgi:acetoacetate decarboxylase
MIGVKVNAGGVEHFGGFSTNLLISSEVGLTQGREIHGQPKKMGSTKIKTVNNEIVAEVFRGNALISRVVMPVSKQAAQVSELEKYFPFRENINHKVIRNIDGTQGINQITSRILGDVVVKECWRGPSKLTIEFNESAPFHLLPVLETIESFYWKADFALVPGSILHDYLKAGA